MDFEEQLLAGLVALLPPAPDDWVAAAQQLHAARQALDPLAGRPLADAERRQIILNDRRRALADEGTEPLPGSSKRSK